MNAIKELRERKGTQQKEFALAMGVSQPTVSEWEHQKKNPSGERLQKVAEYFGVNISVVLGKEPIPGTPPLNIEQEDRELWEAREAARQNPGRRTLFQLAKNGSDRDIEQAVAIIEALRATNPDFYDGDE